MMRTALAALAVLATLAIPGGRPASATPADCDGGGVDFYRRVYGVNFYGRTLELRNGVSNNRSFAMISAGAQPGDLVWIDRSLREMRRANYQNGIPSDQQVRADGGGWKQCGPFTVSQSAGRVQNWQYAARACMRPSDGRDSRCHYWFIDEG